MLYQVKVTFNGEEAPSLPPVDRPIAAEQAVAAVAAFCMEGFEIVSQVPHSGDTPPITTLRKDGIEVVITIIDVEETPGVTISEDELLQRVRDYLLGETIPGQVVQIITEIYSGAWRRNETISWGISVGDVKSIKGWWQVRWIVTEVYNGLVGRMFRGVLVDQYGWSEEKIIANMPLVNQYMMELSDKEGPIIDKVIVATKERFGATPIDLDAAKRLKLRLIAGLNEMGVPIEDDGKYD